MATLFGVIDGIGALGVSVAPVTTFTLPYALSVGTTRRAPVTIGISRP